MFLCLNISRLLGINLIEKNYFWRKSLVSDNRMDNAGRFFIFDQAIIAILVCKLTLLLYGKRMIWIKHG